MVDSSVTGANPQTDVLIFTYRYQCLILIRIRTVIFSAARCARSRGEHVVVQYNTAWTRYKGSERSERQSLFVIPPWGIDSYSLYKYRPQKFLSNFIGFGQFCA